MNQNSAITEAHGHFIEGISRITHFWGFPKAMGAIYGSVYLSPEEVTLDELVKQAGVSKGAVSTNIRILERMGMIHKIVRIGDRKDYFHAETDFWKIVKGILKERDKNEFNLALKSVGESLEMIASVKSGTEDGKTADFYKGRMKDMKKFFDELDSLVAALIALDNLKQATLGKIFRK